MRVRALALVSMGLVATGIAAAAPASATTCPSGYSCTWEDSNFNSNGNTLGYLKFSLYIPHFSDWNYNGYTNFKADNNASSMDNHGTSQTVYYYSNDNCGRTGGTSFSRPIGQNDGDFSNDTPLPGGAFNDVASAGAFSSYVSTCVNAG